MERVERFAGRMLGFIGDHLHAEGVRTGLQMPRFAFVEPLDEEGQRVYHAALRAAAVAEGAAFDTLYGIIVDIEATSLPPDALGTQVDNLRLINLNARFPAEPAVIFHELLHEVRNQLHPEEHNLGYIPEEWAVARRHALRSGRVVIDADVCEFYAFLVPFAVAEMTGRPATFKPGWTLEELRRDGALFEKRCHTNGLSDAYLHVVAGLAGPETPDVYSAHSIASIAVCENSETLRRAWPCVLSGPVALAERYVAPVREEIGRLRSGYVAARDASPVRESVVPRRSVTPRAETT